MTGHRSSSWTPGTFLARLPPPVAGELLKACDRRVYREGHRLITQGDPGTDVFLLEAAAPGTAACVKITADTENGHTTLLGVRLAGDLVGELAAVRGVPRTATVTSCVRLVAHVLPYQDFRLLQTKYREVSEALLHQLAERLDWANRRRLDFLAYNIDIRLARVLLELAERHGDRTPLGTTIGIALSQEEMGRLVGAKPDATGKAFRALRAKGLVTVRRRGVLIQDLGAHRREAQEN